MPHGPMRHNDQNVLDLTKYNKNLKFVINFSISFLVLIMFVFTILQFTNHGEHRHTVNESESVALL